MSTICLPTSIFDLHAKACCLSTSDSSHVSVPLVFYDGCLRHANLSCALASGVANIYVSVLVTTNLCMGQSWCNQNKAIAKFPPNVLMYASRVSEASNSFMAKRAALTFTSFGRRWGRWARTGLLPLGFADPVQFKIKPSSRHVVMFGRLGAWAAAAAGLRFRRVSRWLRLQWITRRLGTCEGSTWIVYTVSGPEAGMLMDHFCWQRPRAPY